MIDYPWQDPPEQERLVVRLYPGSNASSSIAVLEWVGEFFVGIRPAKESEKHFVPRDPMIFATPGLFDLMINGYWGRGFENEDIGIDGIRDLCWSIALSGTTCFLPTIITGDMDFMLAAMSNIDAACRAYPDVAAMVAGIHQEGPWISPMEEVRGAHSSAHIKPPNIDEFDRLQRASGNRIRMLTVAPEVQGMISFIRQVVARNVIVSLGHHQADKVTIEKAVEAGARCITHLGNGCPLMMPRHPNLLWEQLAEDKLYATIIVDGHHLDPATVKVFYRTKPRDKLILISDAIPMAGAPPGYYRWGNETAEMLPNGRFGFHKSPLLIGATAPLAQCLANFVEFVNEGKTPVDYIHYATKVPAVLTGLSHIVSNLGQPGTPATFVIWRWDPVALKLLPQRIVIRGRMIYDVEVLPTKVSLGPEVEKHFLRNLVE